MEFATAAMSSLLTKLGELLLEEYDLQKGLKKGIKDLRDELLIIEAALVKVSDVPLDQLDPLLKIWANDVRELSYAIEDSLDSFMVRVKGLEPEKPHNLLGFIKKTCKTVTKLKIRHEIANDIKHVKIQVKEVKDRYDRYRDAIINTGAATHVGNTSAATYVGNTSDETYVDPRLLALYNKVSNLVGNDEAIVELTKRLTECNDVSQPKLKIVSIVGFGGLGKTTLAKAIYDNLKKKFVCGGFVSVGRNPDHKKVLRDILHELDSEKYKYITESKMDEKQLIDELQEFLADKRYLIVIDDIWDISTWEIIKCAFLETNSENRVITTTRIHDVAKTIGGIYSMKPLSVDNSKRLFYSRIFGVEDPRDQSDEMSDKIFKKCGGVPLSIITLASLLVTKSRDDWSKVFESIGFGHEDNEAVQNTRKILSFSYYDLPFHLKTCLLYLSVYSEDTWIEKNSMIWKWIAEGFIPTRQGLRAFEVGQSYYNDLINRGMVQPVSIGGMTDGCRVHDIVLDLIRNLSSEVNFVRIQETMQHNTCSTGTGRRARRLAIHGRTIEHEDMGHVRSINAEGCSIDGFLSQLSSYKALRVLALENCDFPAGGCRFEHLGKLVQLRYLGLRGTPVTELPTDIGHALKFLQALDVQGSGIKELPPSVGELTKLMYLRASEGTRMMARIGKLTCLEELELHHVDKSPDFATDLGKLTQLRVLDIYLDEIEEGIHKALVKSWCNLRKIQSLMVCLEGADGLDQVDGWEEWAPPSDLRQFSVFCMILPRRPAWTDSSCVPHLSHLRLTVRVIEAGDLQILGRLPSLHFLGLICISTISYTVGSHEFQNLTYLSTNIDIVCGEGALPMLEELKCFVSAGKDVGTILCVGNMPFLRKITYGPDCAGFSGKEVRTAVAAWRQAAETHPNHPYLEIERSGFNEEDSASFEADMIVELGRTVILLTMGQYNVRSEDLQDYFSSIFPCVLNNPFIPDLLSKLGSQSGSAYSLDNWRSVIKFCAEQSWVNRIFSQAQNVHGPSQTESFGDNLFEMMQQMMPVVSQVLAGLPPFEYSLQPQHNDDVKLDSSLQEESASFVADMIVELGRTVILLTMGQYNVHSENLQDYFSTIFPCVLNNPIIPDLLLKLGSQSGSEYSLDNWRSVTAFFAEQYWMNRILCQAQNVHGPGQTESFGNNLSEMMRQMMPVVSQVLAGLPRFEYSLQPQDNDDVEFDSSLQQGNDGADKIIATNGEAGPAHLP